MTKLLHPGKTSSYPSAFWNYKVVDLTDVKDIEVRTLGETEKKPSKEQLIVMKTEILLNRLGAKGWELVTCHGNLGLFKKKA